MATKLSVNLNKIALIRNARGGNLPDLAHVAKQCEMFGAQGITVHPRPDERHIRFNDLPILKAVVGTELNVEGNPTPHFMKSILSIKPTQCTLVPDAPDALTSDGGWDTKRHKAFLSEIILQLREAGIRSSVFIDPEPDHVEGAWQLQADRVELYTGEYSLMFYQDPEKAIAKHIACAQLAAELGIGLNAGHDLNLDNLRYYVARMPNLDEVSIGHALICDSLDYGLQNTIRMYLSRIKG